MNLNFGKKNKRFPFTHNGKTYYKTAYLNPYPQKEIQAVEYLPLRPEKVEILEINY